MHSPTSSMRGRAGAAAFCSAGGSTISAVAARGAASGSTSAGSLSAATTTSACLSDAGSLSCALGAMATCVTNSAAASNSAVPTSNLSVAAGADAGAGTGSVFVDATLAASCGARRSTTCAAPLVAAPAEPSPANQTMRSLAYTAEKDNTAATANRCGFIIRALPKSLVALSSTRRDAPYVSRHNVDTPWRSPGFVVSKYRQFGCRAVRPTINWAAPHRADGPVAATASASSP